MTDEKLIELPEALLRIETFFNEDREPVDDVKDAVFKNVAVYNDDGKMVENYSVDIIDGVDQEFVEVAEEDFKESDRERIPKGQPNAGQWKGNNKSDFNKDKSTKNISSVAKQIKSQYPQLDMKLIHDQLIKSDKLRKGAVKSNKNIKDELKRNNSNVKISGRIKEADSMVGKLARQPENFKDVEDLHDISGVRATAETITDVQNTMDFVRNNYNIIEEKNNIDESRGGYRSYHAIVEKDGIKHEIQIRTENQDKWANYTHDNFYKPANKQQYVFFNRNRDRINEYTLNMSEYFYRKDMGKNVKKPDCPPKISVVVGCL